MIFPLAECVCNPLDNMHLPKLLLLLHTQL